MKSFIPSRRPEGTGAGGTTALGPNIFSILELDRRPQVRVRPVPVYPAELRRQGIGGSATIRIQVDEEGTVFDAVVLNASHPEFGRAARDAALRIRMTPGTRNGQPVRFTFDAPYAFDPG
jgi:protein TonB